MSCVWAWRLQAYRLAVRRFLVVATETREALASPHRTIVNPEEHENRQLQILCQALKDELRRELQLAKEPETSIYSPLKK